MPTIWHGRSGFLSFVLTLVWFAGMAIGVYYSLWLHQASLGLVFVILICAIFTFYNLSHGLDRVMESKFVNAILFAIRATKQVTDFEPSIMPDWPADFRGVVINGHFYSRDNTEGVYKVDSVNVGGITVYTFTFSEDQDSQDFCVVFDPNQKGDRMVSVYQRY